jgi:hypothetical protein
MPPHPKPRTKTAKAHLKENKAARGVVDVDAGIRHLVAQQAHAAGVAERVERKVLARGRRGARGLARLDGRVRRRGERVGGHRQHVPLEVCFEAVGDELLQALAGVGRALFCCCWWWCGGWEW